MAKVLRCKDVGPSDCEFEARGETVDEIMQQAAKHAKDDHGMDEISKEMAEKVQAAIHDE